MTRLANRLQHIDPFYVMEVAKKAQKLAQTEACDPARGGRPMLYLNIGEPDFGPAPTVAEAAKACIDTGSTPYTPATGLPELRRAISGWYAQRWQLDIDPERIVVTAGASAGLQLICSALFEAGDDVLMPDPCYPCNRHFVSAVGATPRLLATTANDRFQLSASGVAAAWSERTRGVLLASPSNPTGTSIAPTELRAIVDAVRQRSGVTLVDEIYLGLSYDARFAISALAHGEDVVSVNSFSKYFSMTGWRLGWLVLPPDLVEPVERLAQNLYICPSTVSQAAALACFSPDALKVFEQRRGELSRRRDIALHGLRAANLTVPVEPDGAFYVWADCSAHSANSWDLCERLMEDQQLVLTPGRDFGPAGAHRHLRLSFATATPVLKTALQRLSERSDVAIPSRPVSER